MEKRKYYYPEGGMPDQTKIASDRAVFKDAYAFIPRTVMKDIVVSYFPEWSDTRAWVLARPLSGFSETFSQTILEIFPGGGSNRPEPDVRVEGVLFVLDGELEIEFDDIREHLQPGSYVYIGPGSNWKINNSSKSPSRVQWIRKVYDFVDGIDAPKTFTTNEQNIIPEPISENGEIWSTTRFVDPRDLRHDMHVNIVNIDPGGAIPFMETHVMEHGIYILQGKGVYRLNSDWIEVEAGDFIWLRAFCPQCCYAGGPEQFRYLLYKDVNRQISL